MILPQPGVKYMFSEITFPNHEVDLTRMNYSHPASIGQDVPDYHELDFNGLSEAIDLLGSLGWLILPMPAETFMKYWGVFAYSDLAQVDEMIGRLNEFALPGDDDES